VNHNNRICCLLQNAGQTRQTRLPSDTFLFDTTCSNSSWSSQYSSGV